MSPADLAPPHENPRFDSLWSFGALSRDPAISTEDIDLADLRASGLVDATFYLGNSRDLTGAATEALAHYLHHGWRQGRRPNPYFDPTWYIAQNLDVQELGTDPLLHYIRYGEREGRRPILHFDPAWYRTAHCPPEGESCLLHFLQRRRTGEVSPLAEFDSGWYLRSYPDVAQAGMDPMEHYLVQGYKEARNPSPRFDTRFYKLRYLRNAPGENPLLHYLRNRDTPGILLSMPADETSIPREVRRNTSRGPAFEEFRPLPDGAPRRAMVLAYYLPQFHPVAENEAWWGRGFTEWTNLGRALPRFAGHYQPRIPGDLGHYRLEGTDTLRRQVALAKGAGLFGFVFYFYWFDGHRLLDAPLEAFLADRSIDFPFALMWANENWTRRWDGSDEEVLIRQHYRDQDETALIATFARHFADPRYIRLDGRPVLMIYRPGLIPDAAASVRRWRSRFRDLHGDDPIFVMAQVFGDNDPSPFGMDGAIEFPPHKLVSDATLINSSLTYLDDEFSAQVYDYDEVAALALAEVPSRFPLIRTVIPGWDNEARRQGAGLVVHGATPAKYQAWLERSIHRAQTQPFFDVPLVCVNAWNEWAEGAYLEPDIHYGAAFLNATGRAVAGMAAANAIGRLLLVGHDAFPAGAQHLLLHLGARLSRRFGVRVEFLLLAGGTMVAEYEKIGPVTVPADDAALERFLADRHVSGIRSALVNTSVAATVCVRLEALGIACTLLIHELPRLLRERDLLTSVGHAAEAASCVVFGADWVRDRFVEATGLPAGRTTLVRQGSYREIAFSAASRRMHRRARGLSNTAILAIGMGYADLRKGFDLFLQVWLAVQRRGRRVHMMWIGDIDPTMRSYLGAEIAAAEATGTFEFVGWRDDVDDLLCAADVMLLTSREDAYPAAVLEALSIGLPLIAFEGSGGIPGLLRRHDAGTVVAMADTAAVARGLAGVVAKSRGAPLDVRARRAAAIRAEHCFDGYAASLLRLAQPTLKTISVAVTSYNYARFLPARLASIFTQTYPVSEIIVCDDCSEDGSAETARGTAAHWKRDITVVENAANSGSAFRQWLLAAERATGEFLWIAEADDGSDPAFLEHLVGAMGEVPDAIMGFTDSRCIDGQDRPIRSTYRDYYAESAGVGALARDDVFQAAGFARRFLVERNLILNVSAVLWRRTSLLDALLRCAKDLSALHIAGDWRVYLELLAAGDGSVVYVAAPLNVHRRHDDSATHRLDWPRHLKEIADMQALAASRLDIDQTARDRQKLYLRGLAKRHELPVTSPVTPPPKPCRATRKRTGVTGSRSVRPPPAPMPSRNVDPGPLQS